MRLSATAILICITLLLLITYPISARAQVIEVGSNVQISGLRENDYFYNEVRIAADPFDANHLIACATESFHSNADSGTVAFVSDDRGASWRLTLELINGGTDEECEFGDHGDAYFVAHGYEDTADLSTARLVVHWSADGGHTWQERASLPFIDREQLAVDRTKGAGHDMLYIVGRGTVGILPKTRTVSNSPSSTIYRSRDRGRFFDVAQVADYDLNAGVDHYPSIFHTHPVVLSDGTLVFFARRHYRDTAEREPPTNVYASRDNGRSFSLLSVLNHPIGGLLPPDLAVAPDSASKDRLYAVFCGPTERGKQTPHLISSDTGGTTWSIPIALGPSFGPCLMPTLAVNKFGVVGISWYSGKADTKFTVSPDGEIKFDERTDVDVRFTASMDGGKTALPSVIINPIRDPNPLQIPPYVQFMFSRSLNTYVLDFITPKGLGETAGIVADAQGSFHPDWIDYRTGTGRLWTATIDVSRSAASNRTDIGYAGGSLDRNETSRTPGVSNIVEENALAARSASQQSLSDVTSKYKAHMLRLTYDKEKSTFEADIQLEGPAEQLKRGVYLQAGPEPRSNNIANFMNADNGSRREGARWLFRQSASAQSASNDDAKSQVRCIIVQVPRKEILEGFPEIYLRVLLPER